MMDNIATLHGQTGIQAEPTSVVHLGAGEGGEIVLPQGLSLTQAEFAQEGSDLVLTYPDGTQVTIEGYFDLPAPPPLVSADGAQIPGEVAVDLDRPRHPLWWLLLWPLRFHEGPSENLEGRIPGLLTESGFDPVSVADRWAGFVTFWHARKPAGTASATASSRK